MDYNYLYDDILTYCIFSILPNCGLVTASMVCQQWRQCARKTKKLPTLDKHEIMCSLFEYSVEFILWFQNRLNYPTFSGEDDRIYLWVTCLSRAVCTGNLPVLRYVRQLNMLPIDNPLVCSEAAGCGQLEVLKWARKIGCEWTVEVCIRAASHDHLGVLQWARENGCEWNLHVCAEAAGNGHLEVLKWARLNGCDWDAFTCAEAAAWGNFEVLKWARSNGCNWNADTCSEAARGGHLEILKWAYENGCPFDVAACLKVSAHYPKIQEWIKTTMK